MKPTLEEVAADLRSKGMLSEEPMHPSCPFGARCGHSNQDQCKQARVVADHKAACGPDCNHFSPSRGIPQHFTRRLP